MTNTIIIWQKPYYLGQQQRVEIKNDVKIAKS